MTHFEAIADNYINQMLNPKRCFHYDILQEISHIKLFLENDTHPKCQYILAYYYSENGQKDKALEYVKKAIDSDFLFACNMMGYLLSENKGDNEEILNNFLKSANVGHIGALRNLGYWYNKHGDIEKSIKYYKLGIEKGMVCCETDLTYYYHKDDENYNDLLLSYAMNGCRFAFQLIYRNSDIEKRHYIDKLVLKSYPNMCPCIEHLLDYYENKNKYKFFAILERYKPSTDGSILLIIAKKYFRIRQFDTAIKLLIESIKYGNYDAYVFLKNNTDGNITKAADLTIITDLLELQAVDDFDKTSLVAIYSMLGKPDDAKNMLLTITDAGIKEMGKYKYYVFQDNWVKALEILLEWKDSDKYVRVSCELAFLYTKLHDKGNALSCTKKCVESGCYKCMVILADLALQQNDYFEAHKYLIKSRNSSLRTWIDVSKKFMRKCNSISIAENLVNKKISIGIEILLRNNGDIKRICDKYLIENECHICYMVNLCFTFSCGHGMCTECSKNIINGGKCPFCKKPIDGFLLQEYDIKV